MIKGIPIEINSSSGFSYIIPLLSSERSIYQDTLRSSNNNSQSLLNVARPKIIGSDTGSLEKQRIERLFKTADEREKKISRSKNTKVSEIKEVKQDTLIVKESTSRVYSDFIPSFQKLPEYQGSGLNNNFLLNIAEKTVDIHYKVKDTTKVNTSTVSITVTPKTDIPTGFEGKTRAVDPNGWYIFMLLISLSIFAWGKSLYEKYLIKIINAIYNYQTSIQLFRDKNALFRNLSIILQILFPINIGLLLYFLIEFYHLKQVSVFPLANIVIYSFGIFLFFKIKALVYKFIGLVFKVQEDFNEVQHHMNVFNQSLGVMILPFIVSLPFLNDHLKSYFLIALFFIVGMFILLFFFRGLQIVSRKHVSIFFLILYLCAVEILPVVLLIKTSQSII